MLLASRWIVVGASAVALAGLLIGCGGEGGAGGGEEQGESLAQAVDPSVCESGWRWAGGDEESASMHPGRDCIDCHQAAGEGPSYAAAGTVYASLDAADDCFGVAGALVEIVDGDGTLHSATSNEAGSFHFGGPIATPYTARVTFDGVVNDMLSPQTDLNCARCHTAGGVDGAPGRVTVSTR